MNHDAAALTRHLMKVERQSLCLEEREPNTGLPASMEEVTMLGGGVRR